MASSVAGQNTVTRVPVVTRERLRMFLTIGSCLIWLTVNRMRCLTPRASIQVSPLLLAAEHVGHRQDGLQRVALAATSRADVGFARRDANVVVDDAGDGLGRNAGTVVLDDDARRLSASCRS